MVKSFLELKEIFEAYLKSAEINKEQNALYKAANYILHIGGKRIRPILLLMTYNLYDENPQTVLDASLAIEVFHNFTLIHDDIMDKAKLRRGEESVHHKFGENTAILSGDLMLMYAYRLLAKYAENNGFNKALHMFTQTGIEICKGQQLDMEFESKQDVQVEDYLTMITGKTAVLLGSSMYIGAVLGGAHEQDAKHLYEFGKNLGIAFQLQDDVLDAFGDHSKIGKKRGGDILQNKKTYLYIKALELSSKSQKEELVSLYSISEHESTKVDIILQIFKDLGVMEYSRQLQEAYQQLAFSHLDATPSKFDTKNIKDLALLLLNRTF